MAIHPGDVLAGYRVTRLLGRGGMGEVWAAVPASADPYRRDLEPVALKVLLARAALKPDLVRRFEREAAIASTIRSPYVCRFIEVLRADDGALLLVFEHLTGESLADRLKREHYLPFTEVHTIVEDVLRGLVDAHAAGVIHRDLKPGNIFLVKEKGWHLGDEASRAEHAKILDFGISKLTKREGTREPTLTAFDATLGSFAYMAPEQVRGAARADERADLYAVGVVAFRALAGRLPFEGANAAALVALKLERSAPSLAHVTGEQWPAGVERFLERALERDREARFERAVDALDAWMALGIGSSVGNAEGAVPGRSATSDGHLPVSQPGPQAPPAWVGAGVGEPQTQTPGVSTWPGLAPPPPPLPPARAPMPSYPLVEDNPTEVDEPPTMSVEDPSRRPRETSPPRNPGR